MLKMFIIFWFKNILNVEEKKHIHKQKHGNLYFNAYDQTLKILIQEEIKLKLASIYVQIFCTYYVHWFHKLTEEFGSFYRVALRILL